ncbi:MAG: acyl-CoA thioesterase [Gammaproteobacteria bacterium]|nr:acyl-CoA thioesterase [Gammaproteobacteria bacterium]
MTQDTPASPDSVATLAWDRLHPFILPIQVTSAHIDVMGHTNNVVYLEWLEKVAWAHSNSLGLDWDVYRKLNRALVARRHEIDYLAATFAGDALLLGTWIVDNDRKLSLTRRYQIIRPADGVTVLRGQTHWVCIELDSGKPRRMPPEFADGYIVSP